MVSSRSLLFRCTSTFSKERLPAGLIAGITPKYMVDRVARPFLHSCVNVFGPPRSDRSMLCLEAMLGYVRQPHTPVYAANKHSTPRVHLPFQAQGWWPRGVAATAVHTLCTFDHECTAILQDLRDSQLTFSRTVGNSVLGYGSMGPKSSVNYCREL